MMRVCSFHTDAKYAALSKVLETSAASFGLPISIYAIADQGSWRANVAQKPGVILQCMKQYPDDDILYIDADATIERDPVIDWDDAVQFAAFYDARPNNKMAPCGGTLWIKNSNLMRAAIGEWKKLAEANIDSADDWIHLANVMKQFPPHMVKHLEPAWLWHEKTMRSRFPGAKPIVVHQCVGEHNYKNY